MNEFEGIGFENLKVLKNKIYFDAAPITIITGTNNSGKSGFLSGLKILKENFKDVQVTWRPEAQLNLEKILETTIQAGSSLKKHGNLRQFVSRGSEKQEFSFSFRKAMIRTDDVAEITFNININETEFKDAYIKNVVMKTYPAGKEILSITYSSGLIPYYIKLDFCLLHQYFKKNMDKSTSYYDALNNIKKAINNKISTNDVEKMIECFNNDFDAIFFLEKNDTGCYSLEEGLSAADFAFGTSISNLLDEKDHAKILAVLQENNSCIYDFSFLWADDINKKSEFEKIMQDFYRSSIAESYNKFQLDINKFLSDVDWHLPHNFDIVSGINFLINPSESTSGLGLKKFTDLFTNHSRHQLVVSSRMPDGLIIHEEYFQSAIEKNSEFYSNVLKPILQQIADYSFNDINFKENRNKHASAFDLLTPTLAEKYISNLILDNLNLIQSAVGNFSDFEFLSTTKIENKRTYSLADEDQFSILIKKMAKMPASKKEDSLLFINKWLKEFEIADAFSIEFDTDTPNFKPYLQVNGTKILLADFGSGSSQLLPLLLEIAPDINLDHELYMGMMPEYKRKFVVLEEPEANFHPALQSKLADLIVEVQSKYNIHVILETHSEYLIRKLQYLIASTKYLLKSSDVLIYYFHHPERIPPGSNQVKKITIESDGTLSSDFGTGFFDESDKIAMSIWNLNKSQKN